MKFVESLILILSLYSCSKCDCSYDNFKKIEKSPGLNQAEVEKILKTKPSAEKNHYDWTLRKYSCGDEYIIAIYEGDRCTEVLFNTQRKYMNFKD